MVGPEEVPPLGHLVDLLTGDGEDVASLTRVLTGALADALPAGVVEVDYDRSAGDRLRGRPGVPKAVRIDLGDTVLSLSQSDRGRTDPQILHRVRGVVLTRRTVPITEWIETLARGVQDRARDDEQARAALSRLLLG
jgi:hypothetical protein